MLFLSWDAFFSVCFKRSFLALISVSDFVALDNHGGVCHDVGKIIVCFICCCLVSTASRCIHLRITKAHVSLNAESFDHDGIFRRVEPDLLFFFHISSLVLSSPLFLKWSEGDQVPSSWRQYYQDNPCVPIDYPTLPAALATAEVVDDRTLVTEQHRTIRVLLRPGDYILREAIVIQASDNVRVTIETMKGPFTANHQVAEEERTEPSSSPTRKFARKAANLKHRLGCRSAMHHVEMLEPELDHPPLRRLSSSRPPCDVASLILRTRRHNEPIIRVRQGAVKLINLELLHNSHGVDIWNGNAAIQIQPPLPGQTLPTNPPTACMESVEIVSHSGRGIVNIDGGIAVIKNCYVHDCAATGIYVGGPGSQAHIERTDVLNNGNGSRNRRGIGSGHSGVYLEQGKAFIRDCNISRNSLTGISAVSSTNSVLDMEASDVVANGAAQLEVPRGHAIAHSLDFTRTNRLAAFGFIRARSGLVHEPHIQEAMGL